MAVAAGFGLPAARKGSLAGADAALHGDEAGVRDGGNSGQAGTDLGDADLAEIGEDDERCSDSKGRGRRGRARRSHYKVRQKIHEGYIARGVTVTVTARQAQG